MNVAQQDWIKELPPGWSLASLRDVLIERKDLNKNREETNILSVTNDRGVINYKEKGNIGNKASDDIERYKKVYKGDIVANSMNVIIGSVGISPENGVLSPVYIVMRPAEKVDVRYYDYIFKAKGFQAQLKRIGYGILDHRMRIPWDNLKMQLLPKPDFETQQKIADFLDTETAKIDNLITKQEQLLKLLEEKRRATITHVVTRGLNPHAELKQTNIPWVSKTPEHWEIKRLKDIFTANDDALSQKTDPNYEFEYVDISSVDKYDGITNKELMKFENAPSRARRMVKQGDIIIGAVRTYLEAIAQITEEVQNVVVSTGFVVMRPKKLTDSDYYIYALRAGTFMASVVGNSDGVSYPAINADKLMSLHIPVPPPAERVEIAAHCKAEMKQMDKLKQKIQTQISLLRERRTSLISHAVTGKIRV